VLVEAAERVGYGVADKEPVIMLSGFGDSAVEWDISIWTSDPWLSPRLRSDLNEGIWWALKDAGITIAYPQVDVHFPDGAASGGKRRQDLG